MVMTRAAAADEPEDALALARQHFERGRDLFNKGDLPGAIREFSAGYDIAPRPEFLLNLGQAYRRIGELARARAFYEKYLVATSESDARRAQVREIIAELAGELARVAPPREEKPPPAVAPQAPIPALKTGVEPGRQRARRRLWWILPAAVLVTAGAAVGIYFAAAPRSYCGGGALDCLNLSQVR
jgi:tetratricopeptide (TPR) repeat protein